MKSVRPPDYHYHYHQTIPIGSPRSRKIHDGSRLRHPLGWALLSVQCIQSRGREHGGVMWGNGESRTTVLSCRTEELHLHLHLHLHLDSWVRDFCKEGELPLSPVPSPQSPAPSPQSPAPSPQSPAPSPRPSAASHLIKSTSCSISSSSRGGAGN
jgi:hypothetical protein